MQHPSPLTSPTSHMKCVILLTLLFAGEKQDGSLASLLMFSPTPEGDGEEEGKDKKKKKKSETMHFKETKYRLHVPPWDSTLVFS